MTMTMMTDDGADEDDDEQDYDHVYMLLPLPALSASRYIRNVFRKFVEMLPANSVGALLWKTCGQQQR